jgi:hypothetical protein
MLDEHTVPCDNPKHCDALRRRGEGRACIWGTISRLSDDGGYRDFLDDQPISCGSMLELQAVDYKDDDFGEYSVYLNKGHVVRYEANLSRRDGGITLYSSIGGHRFVASHHAGMRFRWPKR